MEEKKSNRTRGLIQIPLVLVTLALLLSTCGSDHWCEDTLKKQLDPGVYQVLNWDDEEFNNYCESCGYFQLYQMQRCLYGLIDLESEARYIQSTNCIFPYMKRVCEALSKFYDCDEFYESVAYFERQSPEQGLKLMRDWQSV